MQIPSNVEDGTQPVATDAAPLDGTKPEANKKWTEIRQAIDVCKVYRRKLIRNWAINIDYRRGKTFSSQADDDQVAVNLDWSLTKTKQAALFSQVPKVRIDHAPESIAAGPWVQSYERRLNDTLVTAGIEAAMDEVLPDCINAAGIGIALVAHETLSAPKQIPSVDTSVLPQELQDAALQTGQLNGMQLPMATLSHTTDSRYVIKRISPADLLWPLDFTGSDYDQASWLGYTGRLTWAEAKSRFNLQDEDKESLMGDQTTTQDRLSHDYDRAHLNGDDKVGFDEIFFNLYKYDPTASSFNTIWHLVYLHNKVEPVIDEQWNGQKFDPQTNTIGGCLKKPIRVLTLTYITDDDIPPSDSAIGRSQVNELNKGRTHINKQRARNAPWIWFDVNRLDPAIQTAMMRGIWQHAVPVQGDGSRVIGTIQQPAMHQENFLFDKIAKSDLQELWTIGENQLGGGGDVETKGEANTIQSNYMTKVTRERAKVTSFVVGIAECLGGQMILFEDPTSFGQGFDPSIASKLEYSILADSTVVIDSNQRLGQLNNFVNTYAKSGWINLEPVLKEIATLVGLDPATVIIAPKPPPPEQPNISLRLTGAADMMNPLLLAFMIKAGLAPEAQFIDQAKQLIQQSVQMPPVTPGMPGAPSQVPVPPGGPQLPGLPPVATGQANPQLTPLPSITQQPTQPSQVPQ